ncbi:class I SAM-dependent methyltransferase [Kribbella qitaiheensis]|uniref:Class I SAM-dependent methyltransferase n=1 Tax=Kribbella qitaiheensis TaxID=1544730 RepID=A0A7G6X270_9ACTN|nr:class I SAM-dependent methyltransferase [Kribbella qitaiheensis]QNE20335.1 class I SAM-dependent methyltransferase [Kribbella qitaiheensis]
MTKTLATVIRENYSAIATTYDGKWADVLAVHGRAVTDRLDLAAARRVAEIGCGPGRLLSYLERLAPQARIIGTDLTEAMLRRAPARFARVAGDAEALPFAEDSLDAIVMPFVLFHLPDLPTALSEVRRILAPGGCFAAVTWSGHDPHPAYDVWVRVIDEHEAPPDPSPQMPSGAVTSDPVELELALRAANFDPVDITVERFRHRPTAGEFLAHSQVIGSMARRIALLPADRRASCLAAAERELAGLEPEAFTESGTVLYTTAR